MCVEKKSTRRTAFETAPGMPYMHVRKRFSFNVFVTKSRTRGHSHFADAAIVSTTRLINTARNATSFSTAGPHSGSPGHSEAPGDKEEPQTPIAGNAVLNRPVWWQISSATVTNPFLSASNRSNSAAGGVAAEFAITALTAGSQSGVAIRPNSCVSGENAGDLPPCRLSVEVHQCDHLRNPFSVPGRSIAASSMVPFFHSRAVFTSAATLSDCLGMSTTPVRLKSTGWTYCLV